jgi:DNA-binding transcriptional MocR family regulator
MSLLYEELADRLSQAMLEGAYKPGSRLPSIRELSERYACSRNTSIRAYEELERRNVVYSVPKSGFYMVERPDSGTDLAFGGQHAPGAIDMASASPDERSMPYEDFRQCLNRAVDLYKDKLFVYGQKEGLITLRELLAKRLYSSQIFARTEQLFIFSGTQQAIHLLSGMPFPNGKSRILLEQPSYPGIIRAAALQGATSIGIDRTGQELDLEELERQFRHNDIKFFYTMSRFHNPTGASYTMEVKKSIVRLAGEYGVYILEDDYLGDLDSDPKNDSMAAMDRSEMVIHMRSFSKTVLPGIRLGYAVVPPALVPALREHKSAADAGSSALTQGALEIYLKTGMFDRHLKEIRSLYGSRMEVLKKACAALLPPSIRFSVYDNGIFGMVELPGGISPASLCARLERLGLNVAPGTYMRIPDHPGQGFIRLSIIRADEEEIRRGVSLLASELAHALKQGSRRLSVDDPSA